MTRTDKWVNPEDRYFTHNGHAGEAPNHVKKDGFGKGNRGRPGDEVEDMINEGEIPEKIMPKQRRGSNHSMNENRMKAIQKESRDYHLE